MEVSKDEYVMTTTGTSWSKKKLKSSVFFHVRFITRAYGNLVKSTIYPPIWPLQKEQEVLTTSDQFVESYSNNKQMHAKLSYQLLKQ